MKEEGHPYLWAMSPCYLLNTTSVCTILSSVYVPVTASSVSSKPALHSLTHVFSASGSQNHIHSNTSLGTPRTASSKHQCVSKPSSNSYLLLQPCLPGSKFLLGSVQAQPCHPDTPSSWPSSSVFSALTLSCNPIPPPTTP